MNYNSNLSNHVGFKRPAFVPRKTVILSPQQTDDGEVVMVERVLNFKNSLLPAEDYSLGALLRAGINPSSLHCNTGITSDRLTKEQTAKDFLQSLGSFEEPSTPPVE